jgi:hypothetical protein
MRQANLWSRSKINFFNEAAVVGMFGSRSRGSRCEYAGGGSIVKEREMMKVECLRVIHEETKRNSVI